jgi:dTDP-4-amino-4,6-dideoxygalactose transaminase
LRRHSTICEPPVLAIARQRIQLPRGAWRSAAGSLLKNDLWEGPDVAALEHAFASYIGSEDAVAVPSGRAGFRFLFDALQLESGGEVLCSAFGYPVVPFLIPGLGYKVRFVDCEMQTLGMDPQLLASAISRKTAAVVGTHLYGVPCQIDRIAELARAYNAALVEDCAHCYGAAIGEKKVGSFGNAGCFSFETSKVINTMGGGIVTVSSKDLGSRIRQSARTEPRNRMKWLFKRLATTTFESLVTNPVLFNLGVYQALRLAPKGDDNERFASGYHGDEVSLAGKMGRYTNYQAGLGLDGMQTVDEIVRRRKANAERLIANLGDIIKFQQPTAPDVFANFMLVTAIVPNLVELSHRLLKAGIDTKHLYMRDCSRILDDAGHFPNAARAEKEVLHIPAHPHMSTAQIDAMSEKIRKVVADL